MDEPSLRLSPSEFVAILNQTLEFAYPSVVIEGELSNFRVSKNRWVYFDLKDELASVKFFGTVYSLPGPLEEGMRLRVSGAPRVHPLYGFSVTIQSIALAGEGTIKKAFDLLLNKLTMEGLFDAARKRPLPYPPERIGLITSAESAALVDFTKILNARWSGLQLELADVQVQGEAAPGQIVRAVEYFNTMGDPPDVLVIIRGGGSADDLQTFNTEAVTRAVAASRIPTLVAIGHEIDVSLAELAADLRASTPSNAAELLVPDRKHLVQEFAGARQHLGSLLGRTIQAARKDLVVQHEALERGMRRVVGGRRSELLHARELLQLLDPKVILRRGYAIVKKGPVVVRQRHDVKPGDRLDILLSDGNVQAEVQ